MNFRIARQAVMIASLALVPPLSAFAQPAADPHHPAGEQGAPAATPAPAPAAQPGGQPSGMPMQMGPGGMMPMMGEMMKMMGGMMGGTMAAQPKGDTGPSSQAFNGLTQRMHQDMQMTWSGNADVDFVKAMIPHHQGAIDMAKTVVAFGKDPEVRKLAEAVIKSQEAEVATMKAWLAAQKK